MFGCGLPVCALNYSCIGELVTHEHNGLLFATPEELAQQFLDLFRGFPPQQTADEEGGQARTGGSAAGRQAGGAGNSMLARLRAGVQSDHFPRWDASWRQVVLPVLDA